MSKEISVKDVRSAATFMLYVAVLSVIFFVIGASYWFMPFLSSPFGLIGLGMLLLISYFYGKLDGTAHLLEQLERKSVKE